MEYWLFLQQHPFLSVNAIYNVAAIKVKSNAITVIRSEEVWSKQNNKWELVKITQVMCSSICKRGLGILDNRLFCYLRVIYIHKGIQQQLLKTCSSIWKRQLGVWDTRLFCYLRVKYTHKGIQQQLLMMMLVHWPCSREVGGSSPAWDQSHIYR